MKKVKRFYSNMETDKIINEWVQEKNINIINIESIYYSEGYGDNTPGILVLYEDGESIEDNIKNKYESQIEELKSKIKALQEDHHKFKEKIKKMLGKNKSLLDIIKEHQKGGMMLDVNVGDLSLSEDSGQLSIEEDE